jgi:hypothetical protein
MPNEKREILTQQTANSNVITISCTDCSWEANLQPASGRATEQEEREFFNSHNCKDFPRCDAPGCKEKAVEGFQPFIEVGNFENPNAKILGSENWWCKKHESLGYEFAGASGNSLTPSE